MSKTCKKSLICLFVTFFLLFFLVQSGRIVNFDSLVYDLLSHSKLLTKIMKSITIFGESITLILLCVVTMIFFKNKRVAMTIPLNLLLITLITQIIKFIVKRPRPAGINLIVESGFSFPSGHSTAAFAFYGFIIYLIYKNIKNKKLKIILISILSILIILIGISRIYLGVHFASDVIAGFILSSMYLIIFIYFLEKKTPLQKSKTL